MVKVLRAGVVVLVALSLSGCFFSKTVRIKTEVQETYVPILYCPAPPQVDRPSLVIDELLAEDGVNPGKVVKHYKATIIQLQGYAKELETILEGYDENNEAYDELRKQFNEEWAEKIPEDVRDEVTRSIRRDN